MSKLNQKGVVHLLVPIILILGLIAAVWLVTSSGSLKLFSKAAVSEPVGPEVSLSLVGPQVCTAGWLCGLYGQYGLEDTFEVKLYARSDIENSNLFKASLTFPRDLVSVKEIKTDRSFAGNWIENYYDNATGEISLTAGLPAPGYQTVQGGPSGLMATIVFTAKAVGKGTISLADSSAIYSNLNNINILFVKRGYDISIEKPVPTPISAPVTPAPTSISIPTPTPASTPVPTSVPSVLKGDGNNDGKINLVDMSIIHTDWMKTKSLASFRQGIDMNDDGVINTFDFSIHRALLISLGVIKVR